MAVFGQDRLELLRMERIKHTDVLYCLDAGSVLLSGRGGAGGGGSGK